MEMKKLGGALCACAMLLTLSGCKDAVAGVSDAKQALVTVGDTKITKGAIYDILKNNAGAKTTITLVMEKICEAEGITVTDEMKEQAEKEWKDNLKTSKVSEEEMLENLNSYGIESKEQYFEVNYYATYKKDALYKKYINENKKSVFNTFNPTKAKVMMVESEDDAKKALEKLQDGEDFEKVAKEYGNTTTYSGKEDLYTSESGLPDTVFAKIANVTGNGLIESILQDTTSSKYYLAEVIEHDNSKFEDEAIEAILADGDSTTSNALQGIVYPYYLEKYDFHIYDIDIYNGIKDMNENYIIQD